MDGFSGAVDDAETLRRDVMQEAVPSLPSRPRSRVERNVRVLSFVLGILTVLVTGLYSDWSPDGRAQSTVVLALSTFLAISVWLVLHVLTENAAERRALELRLDDFRKANEVLAQLTDLRAKPGIRTLAEVELTLFGERLQGMRDGLFSKYVSLPSEQISGLFVPLMNDLIPRKGTWKTLSVPSFWHERNVGSSRGFIEANARAAEAGVIIDRVLIIDRDPGELHGWQKRVLSVLFFESAQRPERMLLQVVKLSDGSASVTNFGIWDSALAVEMHYRSADDDGARLFERIDTVTKPKKLEELMHTFDRWKACRMLGLSDVTEEAREVAKLFATRDVKPVSASAEA